MMLCTHWITKFMLIIIGNGPDHLHTEAFFLHDHSLVDKMKIIKVLGEFFNFLLRNNNSFISRLRTIYFLNV